MSHWSATLSNILHVWMPLGCGCTQPRFYDMSGFRIRNVTMLEITCYGIKWLCLPDHVTSSCHYIFYLWCVFLDCRGFALVPMYLPTMGLTYRYMSTQTLMYHLVIPLVRHILLLYHNRATLSNSYINWWKLLFILHINRLKL